MSPEKKRPPGEFEHIGSILQNVMKQWQQGPHAELILIIKMWNAIVGETVAQNAQPASLNKGVLTVHVTGPAWTHQLRFHQNDIVQQINQTAGRPLVSTIKFKIGSLHS
jgi:predicted nucleic acid-binding Zn ribbon protein